MTPGSHVLGCINQVYSRDCPSQSGVKHHEPTNQDDKIRHFELHHHMRQVYRVVFVVWVGDCIEFSG